MTRQIQHLAALVALVAACPIAATAQPGSGGGPPPAHVRIAMTTMEPVEQHAVVTGSVRAWRESRIAAREAGRVLVIDVREGDLIEQGGVLATLDDAILRIELDAARAGVRAAEGAVAERLANLSKAERDLDRITSLRATRSASQNEYDDAATEVERARAALDQARAHAERDRAVVQLLESRIDDMTIHAPFTGRVGARLIDAGEWAAQGAPIVRLVATETVDVWLDVPQQHVAAATRAGAVITFESPALGRTFEAPVAGVGPVGDESARTFPVRLTLDSDDEALRPSMNVVARVPVGVEGPSLLVPRDALLRDDAGWFVYTATGPDVESMLAIPARVEQLFTVGSRRVAVRVISGPLFPGAPVVVEGNERILFPSQPLRITNPADLARPDAPADGPGEARRGGGA
ncbi:MAG: efflux RND transporter periplasmic adaptor subunit [Phycisphaerales bacterium]|nr:MAG: efflux RND transporter periplasmic adaptor subunit [Phycisphaerales bacterium]